LSAAERAHHRALRGSKRRLEWLGGRLAAKYLFLHRLEMPVAHDEQTWRPTLIQLSAYSIDAFPDWMYQHIEVSASADPQGAGPRFQWYGRGEEGAVSLSHTDYDACACFSPGNIVGVDLQSVEPRVEPFYRSNFTETEKQWVSRGTGIEPSSRHWLFTLLWTLKEGALKARALLQRSPVSFGGVEVAGLPVPPDVLWAYRKDTWNDRFGLFTARIKEERNARDMHVAYMGTRRLILAVVKPLCPAQHVNSAAVWS